MWEIVNSYNDPFETHGLWLVSGNLEVEVRTQVPYFTDDRSIFFFLNTLASTYRPHRPIQG